MAKDTLASLRAEIDRLSALVANPAPPSVASQHFKARDLPCTWPTTCTKTFRTVKGQTFHREQTKHAAK